MRMLRFVQAAIVLGGLLIGLDQTAVAQQKNPPLTARQIGIYPNTARPQPGNTGGFARGTTPQSRPGTIAIPNGNFPGNQAGPPIKQAPGRSPVLPGSPVSRTPTGPAGSIAVGGSPIMNPKPSAPRPSNSGFGGAYSNPSGFQIKQNPPKAPPTNYKPPVVKPPKFNFKPF